MTLKAEILTHHTFHFKELEPGTEPNRQPYIRFLIFFKKRKDISEEKFHTWWQSVHADLAVAVAGFGGRCLRYVQFHSTPEHKQDLQNYGFQPLEYDAMGEMHVKSLDDWVRFQASPAFSEKLVNDGANFMDGDIKVMAGYDTLIYGSRIETSGGKDGILPNDKRLTPALKESKL